MLKSRLSCALKLRKYSTHARTIEWEILKTINNVSVCIYEDNVYVNKY